MNAVSVVVVPRLKSDLPELPELNQEGQVRHDNGMLRSSSFTCLGRSRLIDATSKINNQVLRLSLLKFYLGAFQPFLSRSLS